MTQNQEIEGINPDEAFATITPLEIVVGFKVAEETYDLLSMREQIIVDLLCAGYNQAEIARVFEISPPSISCSVRRIRYKLADHKLKQILELRVHYPGRKL